MTKIGSRIGAIFGANSKRVEFLGYGTYEGDFMPMEAVGTIAEVLVEQKTGNPRLRLDSGKVVYGCECWWGEEDEIKERLKTYPKIVNVDIDKIRKKHAKERK